VPGKARAHLEFPNPDHATLEEEDDVCRAAVPAAGLSRAVNTWPPLEGHLAGAVFTPLA